MNLQLKQNLHATYKNNILIRFLYTIKMGQVKQNLHASPTRVTDLIRFLYTITQTGSGPGAHECVEYSILYCVRVHRVPLLYAQAQTRWEWVESIVHCVESCMYFFRYVLFHAYFCFLTSLRPTEIEFHTKEIACECKSLCTKHIRHCVLRYICKFKNPRAIVVPSLRSGHYLALGFLNLRMYL